MSLSFVLGLVLFQVSRAEGGTFQVTPVQVFLSAKTSSALLTLRNESVQTLRFQVSVFAWDQSPAGEVLLGPTSDIVFFPSLLTLAPEEERKIRVGRAAPISSREKTYRIFIEELPPLEKLGAQEGAQVSLLTKVGIPIFLQPDKRLVEGHIQQLAVGKALLSFQVKNRGNSHFVTQEVRVRGYGAQKEALFERQFRGWYILAGGSRSYEAELPKDKCSNIKTLNVEVQAGEMILKGQLDMLPNFCRE